MSDIGLAIFDLAEDRIRVATAEEIVALNLGANKDSPAPRYISAGAAFNNGGVMTNKVEVKFNLPEAPPEKGFKLHSILLNPYYRSGPDFMFDITMAVTVDGISWTPEGEVTVVLGVNPTIVGDQAGTVSCVFEIWE